MPQTAQDIWDSVVGMLPLVARPYAVFLAALVAAFSAAAAVANPLLNLWRNITWNAPSRMPTEAEVLRRLMDGKTTRQDAKFILRRMAATERLAAKPREEAVAAIQSMSKSDRAEDKEALSAFAQGQTDKGFAALTARLSKSAKPAASEVRRLGALAYVAASSSALAAYKQVVGLMGSGAKSRAQGLLAKIQKRRSVAADGLSSPG